jgi:uncharacterized phiE125 gp8 family phage protein
MITSNRLVLPATSEPIALAEMYDYLGLSSGPEDAFLRDTLETAREAVERYAGIACLPQTWTMSLDRWFFYPEWLLAPVYPLVRLTEIATFDEQGNQTLVEAGNFDVDTGAWPGRIRVKAGATLPAGIRDFDSIRISYIAGWSSGALVPLYVRRAIKQTCAYMYAHRGDGCSVGDALKMSGAESTILGAGEANAQ